MSQFRILIRNSEPGENILDSIVCSPRTGNEMYFSTRAAAVVVAKQQPVLPFTSYVVEELN